jgi:hypothetical protein
LFSPEVQKREGVFVRRAGWTAASRQRENKNRLATAVAGLERDMKTPDRDTIDHDVMMRGELYRLGSNKPVVTELTRPRSKQGPDLTKLAHVFDRHVVYVSNFTLVRYQFSESIATEKLAQARDLRGKALTDGFVSWIGVAVSNLPPVPDEAVLLKLEETRLGGILEDRTICEGALPEPKHHPRLTWDSKPFHGWWQGQRFGPFGESLANLLEPESSDPRLSEARNRLELDAQCNLDDRRFGELRKVLCASRSHVDFTLPHSRPARQ